MKTAHAPQSALHGAIARMGAVASGPAFAVAFSIAMVIVAGFVIHLELKAHPWPALVAALHAIPADALGLAGACVLVSYFGLALNERFALRLIDKPQSLPRTASVACATYAVSNSLGFSFATANAVRLRFYAAWGLGPLDVAAAGAITGLIVPSATFGQTRCSNAFATSVLYSTDRGRSVDPVIVRRRYRMSPMSRSARVPPRNAISERRPSMARHFSSRGT
jgi:hypothetical protein